MSTATLTRTAHGVEVPQSGTYEIDPAHTSIEFTVRHLGLSKVKGRFTSFSGEIEIAEDPAASAAGVSIDAASFSTGNDDRDGHVKSADFLDVENHPTLSFQSTGVRIDGGDWVVDGELTVAGETRPVSLDVSFEGAGGDPWGGDRIAFAASTEIDRENFGLTWNQALDGGGLLVGKKVRIDLDVQAVRQED